ncbi:hypothetical protein F442_22732 [Phytophthora nicotianae P10297]|uniref:Uncharacterized protein n=1 Tax=Phytophthora nicotianae P10297 TaxID=1317064 RepID=W2Y012_PHYNI|nr:hypothetical protein F442_22732 [Phytophthora nicotianae P10297]
MRLPLPIEKKSLNGFGVRRDLLRHGDLILPPRSGPRRRLRRRRRVRFPNRSSSRGNANGRNTKANLTAEGLVFVGVTYCENECSVQSVTAQIPVVIEQIRSIVKYDSRFGYHFVDGWTIER